MQKLEFRDWMKNEAWGLDTFRKFPDNLRQGYRNAADAVRNNQGMEPGRGRDLLRGMGRGVASTMDAASKAGSYMKNMIWPKQQPVNPNELALKNGSLDIRKILYFMRNPVYTSQMQGDDVDILGSKRDPVIDSGAYETIKTLNDKQIVGLIKKYAPKALVEMKANKTQVTIGQLASKIVEMIHEADYLHGSGNMGRQQGNLLKSSSSFAQNPNGFVIDMLNNMVGGDRNKLLSMIDNEFNSHRRLLTSLKWDAIEQSISPEAQRLLPVIKKLAENKLGVAPRTSFVPKEALTFSFKGPWSGKTITGNEIVSAPGWKEVLNSDSNRTREYKNAMRSVVLHVLRNKLGAGPQITDDQLQNSGDNSMLNADIWKAVKKLLALVKKNEQLPDAMAA